MSNNKETTLNKDATQNLVPIREIRNGVVVLEDNTVVSVLMISSMNFELKSYDEQIAVIKSFKSFLSLLEFPIQISIQSRKMDIKPYLQLLDDELEKKDNPLMITQITEYINFIREFTNEVDIMSKNFYLVITYSPSKSKNTDKKGGILTKVFSVFKKENKFNFLSKKSFEDYRLQLEQRSNILASGITRIGLKIERLSTTELIELYNNIYNPKDN